MAPELWVRYYIFKNRLGNTLKSFSTGDVIDLPDSPSSPTAYENKVYESFGADPTEEGKTFVGWIYNGEILDRNITYGELNKKEDNIWGKNTPGILTGEGKVLYATYQEDLSPTYYQDFSGSVFSKIYNAEKNKYLKQENIRSETAILGVGGSLRPYFEIIIGEKIFVLPEKIQYRIVETWDDFLKLEELSSKSYNSWGFKKDEENYIILPSHNNAYVIDKETKQKVFYTDSIKREYGKDYSLLTSFMIDSVSYQVEEGMTWENWVNSKYNISGIFIDSYGMVLTTPKYAILDDNFTNVKNTDLIKSGTNYSTNIYIPDM